MKKAIPLFLALVLCLSLCACGGNSNNDTPETTQATTTEATTESTSITAETLAGNYKSRLWFLNHSITLNANTSYSFGDNEKGTFQLGENYITLNSKDGLYRRNFAVKDNFIYYTSESWRFDKDEDYGLTFSPDENGFSDQTFVACVIDGELPGCDYTWICLDLNADGSFTLKLGIRRTTSLDILETFEGTYTSNETNLILNYNNQEYPLILNNANHIYFLVYDKV